MEKHSFLKPKVSDFVLIGIIVASALIAALLPFLIKETASDVVITLNGEVYAVLPLREDKEIDVDGFMTVTVENGSVYVSHTECKNRLCMKVGEISNAGQIIACLPNRITVKITGESELDAIAG